MRAPTDIPGYRTIDHPLAQIQAASRFWAYVNAFVVDEWEDVYVDEPPDEEDVSEVEPLSMLSNLEKLGLRFEAEAPPRKEDPLDDDYEHFTGRKFQGGIIETLLHKWAFDVMDAADLDHRAFSQGLQNTDLLFVPDDNGTVARALALLAEAMGSRLAVAAREQDLEAHTLKQLRSRSVQPDPRRGAGPNATNPTLIDRIALTLREAGGPLSAEQIAQALEHPNVPSVTAALHDAAVNRRPKRIAGWLRRDAEGRGYVWAGPTDTSPPARRPRSNTCLD